MVTPAELRKIAVFSDLPDDQINWFLSRSQEITLNAGDHFAYQGTPANSMFVLIEGNFQWRGEFNGEVVLIPVSAGQVSGVLPFSRMKQYAMTGKALSTGRVLSFPASLFPDLVQRMPELTTSLVGMMSDRIREGTRIEQQRDRLASLGKLSAGLAHELNNPASAAKSATNQLRGMLDRLRDASFELGRRSLDDAAAATIKTLEKVAPGAENLIFDPIALSNSEEQIESILRKNAHPSPWEPAAVLARSGVDPHVLGSLLEKLDAPAGLIATERVVASLESAALLNEIESSTSRISDLVKTIKEYTYMDQSPIQNVDVVRSLEATLTILNHKLKHGVTVQRDYQLLPTLVDSFGSELNLVWTNIIDNAIDAMGGRGELRIRTFTEDNCVVVEIGDNGPGIPAEMQAHIFEPFFTTKGVGEGTGLGLDTVQRIVKKHGGNIQVTSHPGNTRFQVWLPLVNHMK